MKYAAPDVTTPTSWAALAKSSPKLAARIDLPALAEERATVPTEMAAKSQVLTDDFSPVEFLDASKANNTKKR